MREIHTGHMINTSDKPQYIFMRDRSLLVRPQTRSKAIPLWKCKDLLSFSYFEPCEETREKLKFKFNNYPSVEGMLKRSRCFILGSGPSVEKIDLSKLDNEFVIAVNHSIVKYPKAKALLFIDRDFMKRRHHLVEEYKGLIFAPFRSGIQDHVSRDGVFIFPFNYGAPQKKLADGLYNATLSGLCALNLALILGASKIYLLGFDLNQRSGKDAHCTIDENVPNGKYSNEKWIDTRLNMFKRFSNDKEKIINCSMNSAIETFTKKPFKDII